MPDCTKFQAGDVFRVGWDERPIRVMMADRVEVFYDSFAAEVGWNLARSRTAVYYRVPTSLLQSSAQRIGTEPFTDQELARHRPDLPLRLLRDRAGEWGSPSADWGGAENDPGVESDRLALIPFGPQGAPRRAVLVEAANGRSFAGAELLALAHRVQSARCPTVHGVGLYRSGVSGGIPSYYLWGAVDKAGHAG